MAADEQQMLRLQAGDRKAFNGLVEKYRRPLVGFLYRMVHDAATAEELAQEVFLRVYRARARYRPSAKFSTWLFTIAANLALNSLRDGRLRRAVELPPDFSAAPAAGRGVSASADVRGESFAADVADPRPTHEQEMIAAERLRAIREAVSELPEKQRLAVVLHKYEELDYAEIAEILGCSESALKSLLFRAYETLRMKLRPFISQREL